MSDRLTLEEYRQYMDMQDKVREIAAEWLAWREVEYDYIEEIIAHLDEIEVTAYEATCGCCDGVHHCWEIPVAFIEDPEAFKEEWVREQDMLLREKLEEKRRKEDEEARKIEEGERKLLEKLKAKYE